MSQLNEKSSREDIRRVLTLAGLENVGKILFRENFDGKAANAMIVAGLKSSEFSALGISWVQGLLTLSTLKQSFTLNDDNNNEDQSVVIINTNNIKTEQQQEDLDIDSDENNSDSNNIYENDSNGSDSDHYGLNRSRNNKNGKSNARKSFTPSCILPIL